MNCKPGDLAVIRGTHPIVELHGVMLTCVEFLGAVEGERDVWQFNFAGGRAHIDDHGKAWSHGLIQDRHIRPIRDQGDDAVDESKAWLPPVPLPTIEPHLLEVGK